MSGFRFSVLGGMAGIALIGLGTAALAQPSEHAANIAFTVALGLVGVAILGVCVCRGPRRTPWLGYLSFAGGYLALCFAPGLADAIRPHLITSTLFDLRYDQLSYTPGNIPEDVWVRVRREFRHALAVPRFKGSTTQEFPVRFDDQSVSAFPAVELRPFSPNVVQRLGHSLCTIPLGFAGAILAFWFACRESHATLVEPENRLA